MEMELERTPMSREMPRRSRRDIDATAAVVETLAIRLHEHGAQGALEFLNARTRYRFTGIYRADPPLLRNVLLHDRENPTVKLKSGAVTPIDETYCGIVVAGMGEFSTGDASRDARLAEHPARESVISYAGVPLRLPSGRTWGTLCHFDIRPRLLVGAELAILHAAAPLLITWLRDHAGVDALGVPVPA